MITPALPAEGSAHVTIDRFASAVRLARRLGEIVPLSEIVRRHGEGRSTAGLIALTFDDAYAAVARGLRDFISRQAVPIAVFPVTNASAAGATFWWDRIDDVFPRVPADRWRVFESACGLPDEYRRGQPREYGPLRPLRQWLLSAYAGRWPNHLEPELAALEEQAGYRTVQRAMTWDELADFAALPEVEIGVHTVSHPVLPLLADSELRQEIATGYSVLRERFATVLPVLAVPFGLYDTRTLRIARSAGMIASLTLAGRRIRGVDGWSALPRCCITRSETPIRLGLHLLGIPELVRTWSGRRAAPYPDLPSATS